MLFYRRLVQLLPHRASVLDLACGNGTFLREALQAGAKRAVGVELSEECVLRCIQYGLSVYQGDITDGLADYPDKSFDCVSLIRTIELLKDPEAVLEEMLRVGQEVLLTFTNYGHWRHRLNSAVKGMLPGSIPGQLGGLPTRLTYPMFLRYCVEKKIIIKKTIAFPSSVIAGLAPGLLASEFAVLLYRP